MLYNIKKNTGSGIDFNILKILCSDIEHKNKPSPCSDPKTNP